jgi:hypothetical protein
VFKVFVNVCVVVCCSDINSTHVCRTVRSLGCNELLNMRNSGELSNLECVPTNTENAKYLPNASTCTSCIFCRFTLHNSRFKQDEKKQSWIASTHGGVEALLTGRDHHPWG